MATVLLVSLIGGNAISTFLSVFRLLRFHLLFPLAVYDLLLVSCEYECGLGRSGVFYASSRPPVGTLPDIVFS